MPKSVEAGLLTFTLDTAACRGINVLIAEELNYNMAKLPSKSGSWLTNNMAKRQHDAIHHAISTSCLNEQECYDALWSYLTWQYEIDFVCNPEKREQIITDVEKRKEKLLENTGLCRIED
ncbi:MAG: hypothetical protein WA364_18235 [Candidatus Nitrosopolaris sp.]